jgi:hypothetical protein
VNASGADEPADADTIVARFADDRLADAEAAAAACPVNAIAVDAAADPAADAATDPAADPEASPDE